MAQTTPITLRIAPGSPRLKIVNPNPETNPHRNNNAKIENYKKLTHREHIYLRPGMYIGSDERVPMDVWLYDIPNKFMNKVRIDVPEAIERLFLEILSNAGDNVKRSRDAGLDPGSIIVVMNKSTVSIRNGGLCVPVGIHPEYKIYAPELIFGTLLAGSNFGDERTGVGQNGLGAKLVNVFSKQFMVQVADAQNGVKYTQIWNENMTLRSEPTLEPYKGESFVEITYVLDFERFGYKEYPDEVFQVFARCAADTALTCKVPVIFNGNTINMSMKEYVNLCFGDERKMLFHYEWPHGTQTTAKKNGMIVADDANAIPMIELCVIDAPQRYDEEDKHRRGEVISFVNGMMTRDGGVHTKSAMKSLTDGILKTVNLGRKGKNKNKKTTETKKEIKLTVADVQPHISIILSCWVVNPKYNSQSKSLLTSPNVNFRLVEEFFNPVGKWHLVERLSAALELKYFHQLTKKDGRNRKNVGIEKLKEAQLAGPGTGIPCTLCLTEGKSASAYPLKMISLMDNGPLYFGIYPMKGKPLNFMNADPQQILDNEEYDDIKKALGLHEGVDYTVEENYNTLRYGRAIIMADADDDGKHIIGLVLNMFYMKFPSLLQRQYVFVMRTPVIRMTRGTQRLKFYSITQYEAWKAENPDYKTWDHEYFKGLGSSKDSDIADDTKAPRIISCVYDPDSPAAFHLAFDKKLADERKVWISTWKRTFEIEEIVLLPISAFIQHEVVQYSITNLHRSIPRLMDGLKISQRKILWAAMKKNGYKRKQQKLKVAQLAANAAEITNYHNGEKSLVDAIVTMTQDFVGSYNMPYFSPEAQFGTRYMGGEDCAEARYTYIKLQWWFPYIYRKEDMALLRQVIDEGEEVEPVTFLPIIPMCLVNGSCGIGTGHSSLIPNHNPVDICEWLRAKILGQPLPQVKPWYRGFNGEIEVMIRQPRVPKDKTDKPLTPVTTIGTQLRLKIEDDDPDDVDAVDNTLGEDEIIELTEGEDGAKKKGPRITMMTRGTYQIIGTKVLVTELPIGRWTHTYDKWLEGLETDKEIASKVNLSKHDTIYFEIQGFKNASHQNLRLQKSYGMTNMVLLTMDNSPIKHATTTHILEAFYNERLPYYEARRQDIINTINQDINKHQNKIRFIHAVLNKEIDIFEERNGRRVARKKAELFKQMNQLNLPTELLTSVRASNFTEEEMADLNNKVQLLVARRQTYYETSAAQLWLVDIEEFVTSYCRHNKLPQPGGRQAKTMLNIITPEEELEDDDKEK